MDFSGIRPPPKPDLVLDDEFPPNDVAYLKKMS